MGTTLTQLQTGDANLAFVLAIGGCNYLLTDYADTSAVADAWDATDWSTVYAGLRITGKFKNSIRPWADKVEVSTMTFYVMDADGTDTFGEDVHDRAAGYATKLTADIDPNDASITVVDTSNFAASGYGWIGKECFGYSTGGGGGTTFTSSAATRGYYEPFGTNAGTANRFGSYHQAVGGTYETPLNVKVTTEPRHWIGKWVGLWVHGTTAGVLCTKANAACIWAGRIADVYDTSTGETAIVCEDARAAIRDCVLMRDQFTAKAAEGFYLSSGSTFEAYVYKYGSTPADAADLTVGTDIDAGYYTAAELMSALSEWLNGDANVGAGAGLTDGWQCGFTSDGTAQIEWQPASGFSAGEFGIRSLGAGMFGLGFVTWEDRWHWVKSGLSTTNPVVTASERPIRMQGFSWSGDAITLEEPSGTWIDNSEWLPSRLQDPIGSGENWGLLQLGTGSIVLAKYVSDTSFTNVQSTAELRRLLGATDPLEGVIREGEEGDLYVRQVVLLEGSFSDIILSLLATTGATGYNHATYDESWGHQLGAAIPWEIISDTFENAIGNLPAAEAPLMVYLEKATSLEDVLAPELLLRNANVVMQGGELRIVTPQTPIGSFSQHTLDNSNKQRPSTVHGDWLTPTITTSEFCRNTVKIKYDRDVKGTYRNSVTIVHPESVNLLGEKALSIDARNTFGEYSATGNAVKGLISELAASVLPTWAMPLRKIRRPLGPSLWLDLVPGDHVTFSDDSARDTDGTRGITSAAAVVLESSYDWGTDKRQAFGECELLLTPGESYAIYSPTAQVDDTAANAGYAADTPGAGQSTLTCYAHEHSNSAESADATHFVADDEVKIVEVNPTAPGGATSWTATVVSQSGNTIVLDSNLAAFDTTGATVYRVVSQSYTSAVATQRTDTYQADDADERIQDTADPYHHGLYLTTAIGLNRSDGTELPERHSTDQYGDGVPLSTATHRALCRFVNNFVSYKSARQAPHVAWDGVSVTPYYTTGATSWTWAWTKPYFVGRYKFVTGALSRDLSIATVGQGIGGNVEYRITLSLLPPSGSSVTGTTFSGPYQQATYSHTAVLSIATAQDLDVVAKPYNGLGWMTMEVRITGGGVTGGHIYGIGEDSLTAVS